MTTSACASSLSERILKRVEELAGVDTCRRFLKGKAEIDVKDGAICVTAPSKFAAECIQRRFGRALRDASREVIGDPTIEIAMRVSAPVFSSAVVSAAEGAPIAAEPVSRRTPPLSARQRRQPVRQENPSHSLDTFVVGRCNQLAYSAAVAITQQERPVDFNIVFIHGDCGVGKSHLLQGAAARFRRENPGSRVLYTTGEAFTNAYITAVRGGDINAFRRKHRGLDLLCIDDIHFLSNKSSTQSEFLHTFDAMDLEGARIMLASDEHPARIKQFSRELVSRFSAGMVVALENPDPVTRRRLIAQLARRKSISLTEDAITLLAEHCQGSVREIEGALTRIDAVHRLLPEGRAMAGAFDAAAVRYALGPTRRTKVRRPVKVEAITQCIAETLGVTMPEMLGKSRHKRVVVARSMAAHLARKLTSRSFPEIALAMGRPNHSTVVTACKRVESKIAAAERCDADLDLAAETWGELADELERRVRNVLDVA